MLFRAVRTVCAFSVLLSMASCAPVTNEFLKESSRVVASPSYQNQSRRLAVLGELYGSYESNVWFQQRFSQELIANGFILVERMQLNDVIKELNLDQTGLTKAPDSTPRNSSSQPKDPVLSKAQLKQLGEIYNIKYMVWFGQTPNTEAYARVINLETAEISIVATAHAGITGFQPNILPIALADAISLVDKLPQKTNEPVYIGSIAKGSSTMGWKKINVLQRKNMGTQDLILYRP